MNSLDSGIAYKFNEKILFFTGSVTGDLLKKFDIKQVVYYAEFDWELLLKLISRKKIEFKSLPKYPQVRRDLALLIDQEIRYEEIEAIAFETERKLLKRVNLFDVYEGKNITKGKKSYAVSFTLQDEEKTLTDKQIDKIMKKLIFNYEKKLNATIR